MADIPVDDKALFANASAEAFGVVLAAWLTKGGTNKEIDQPEWWPKTFTAGCAHLAAPQVVIAHLTDPSIVRCAGCMKAYLRAAVEVDPDLCDFCRKPAPGNWFAETTLRYGPVLIVGQVCRTCRDNGAHTRR